VSPMATATHEAITLLRAEHAVSRALAGATQMIDPYPVLLETLGSSLGWQLGAVWQAGRDGDLHCVATWRAPDGERSTFEDPPPRARASPAACGRPGAPCGSPT
jgi:hypothetical protein